MSLRIGCPDVKVCKLLHKSLLFFSNFVKLFMNVCIVLYKNEFI